MQDSYVRRLDNDVRDFNAKFDQLRPGKPTHLTQRKLDERINFMQEELDEFITAAKDQNMALLADSLVDLVYVAVGTVVMMGLPWQDLWDEVQRANMEKIPGKTHRGNLVDVCKPEGWVEPKTDEILKHAGYDRTQFETEVGVVNDKNCLDDEVYR